MSEDAGRPTFWRQQWWQVTPLVIILFNGERVTHCVKEKEEEEEESKREVNCDHLPDDGWTGYSMWTTSQLIWLMTVKRGREREANNMWMKDEGEWKASMKYNDDETLCFFHFTQFKLRVTAEWKAREREKEQEICFTIGSSEPLFIDHEWQSREGERERKRVSRGKTKAVRYFFLSSPLPRRPSPPPPPSFLFAACNCTGSNSLWVYHHMATADD